MNCHTCDKKIADTENYCNDCYLQKIREGNEVLERNKAYLLRKQKELDLTDAQMLEWVKGKRDFE